MEVRVSRFVAHQINLVLEIGHLDGVVLGLVVVLAIAIIHSASARAVLVVPTLDLAADEPSPDEPSPDEAVIWPQRQ